jgi:iron complex outermembrane receptor protein
MSTTPIGLFGGRVALVLAACAVSIAAAAQDESTEPTSQDAVVTEAPAESSDTAAAADPPPSDQPEAQDAVPPVEVIPVSQEPEPPATASDSGVARLDNIVVNAQKREQGMQDVPISMSVLTEEFMRAQGITDLSDAMRFVPSIKVVEYLGTFTPQCRGFTINDANPAFEPPCGVALDGIFYSRSGYFSAGLFDTERLEALRGPQGTTFGKNTTAGVVSVYSKDPTETFTGKADVQYGDLHRRAEAAFGGPMIRDVVNFRFAAMKEERLGYMENTYHQIKPSAPADPGARSREGFRAKLQFPDVIGGEAKLLYEKSEVVTHGLLAKYYSKPGSTTHNYMRQHDPNYDGGENYKISQPGPNDLPYPTWRAHGEWNRPFGDWDVSLLGAFGAIKRSYEIVAPAIPGPAWVTGRRSENSPFMTGELRTVSPELDGLLGLKDLFGWNLGSSRLVTGIFGMEAKLDPIRGGATLNYVQTAGALGAFLPLQGAFVPDSVFYDVVELSGQQYPSESSNYVFHQTATTAAVFAQVSWDMTPEWTLEVGGRLSQEEKTADWDISYSSPAPRSLLNQNGAYTAQKERNEVHFQPKISLGYKVTDGINLFAHVARAKKAGGFNYYTVTGNPENGGGRLDYDPETVMDYGFDVKTMLLDNTLRLNVSLYESDLDNYQVLVEVQGEELVPYNPALGLQAQRVPVNHQEVRNAGRARAKGAEIDLMYLPFEWLTVIGAAGFNASKYLSFPLDTCGGNETPDPETKKCDHSGHGFPNVPSWTTSLSVDSRFPLGGYWDALGDLEFMLGAGMEYVTKAHGDGAESGCCLREPYALYRGHVGVGSLGQGWTFRLTGLNLTDDYIYSFKSSTSEYTFGAPLPPRTFFGQINYNFY